MKYTPVLFATVILGISIAAGVAYGAPLTEQQLLKMKAAGISQDVIAAQIKSNGIAFPPDPDTTIALKKAGFSDAVLSALVTAQTGPVAASLPQSNAPEKQTVAQAQVDPCVAVRQEYERLDNENNKIMAACEQIANPNLAYANHCKAMNYSLQRRLDSFPDPNKCINMNPADRIHLYDYDDKDLAYAWPQDTVYKAVATLQSNDSKYSCAQLKVLTWDLQEHLGQMDKSIQKLTGQSQTHSQMAQAASVIAPTATAASAGMQMMSSSDGQKAGSIQQVRDSQQKRHDYLMQIYFQKRCDD